MIDPLKGWPAFRPATEFREENVQERPLGDLSGENMIVRIWDTSQSTFCANETDLDAHRHQDHVIARIGGIAPYAGLDRRIGAKRDLIALENFQRLHQIAIIEAD